MPASQRITDRMVAGSIFVATVLLLLATTDVGFTRDEGFYFRAGQLYVGWFEDLWANLWAGDLAASFSQENIDQHWAYNPEHPVLMKAAFALSHKIFHDILGVMSPSTAWRFPAMLCAAALVSGVYLFARELGGQLAGLVAAAALLFQPRFFFHAHMACFDVPITAFWFWVTYAYWRSYDSKRWALATGILFGLALSVKLNAFFLPIVLVGHWVLTHWREFRFQRTEDDEPAFQFAPIPKAFWSMLVFGPLLFYALWPRHWFDTFARVRWYMEFHLEHEHYFVQYFGQDLQIPPFPVSYPWVMSLVTIPTVILVAFAIGAIHYFWQSGQWQRWKDTVKALGQRRWPQLDSKADYRGTGLLLAINIIFPIALIASPDTPIFGGTKHWMPAMPFVAILAGLGVVAVMRGLRPWVEKRLGSSTNFAMPIVAGVLTACVVVPAARTTVDNHPQGTAYYNELIGSYQGAADGEMVRQFWGHSSGEALPWLNEHASEDGRVWIHKILGHAWDVYLEEERARPDLRASSQRASNYALYHQQAEFSYLLLPLWEDYGTMAPAHVVDIAGVPLVSVYVRPDSGKLKYPDVWR